MTVMVTGGGGLLGSRIVNKLLARGETVVSFDTNAEQPRLEKQAENPQLKRVSGDIRAYDQLSARIREFSVGRIIHMAAVLAPVTEKEPAIGFAVNIGGTTNVLEAARHCDVQRVCYASSISTYGDQSQYGDGAVDEDSLRIPYNLYGHAKVINEETAKAYTHNFGLDTRGIRIAMVFGHGRLTGRSSAMSRVISAAAVGEAIVSDVAADQVSPSVPANDVAEIMVRVCFADNLQLPVYAGLNTPATIGETAEVIRRYLPDADIRFADNAVSYPSITNVDASRLEQAIDYRLPPFEQSILEHINEARAERQMPLLG